MADAIAPQISGLVDPGPNAAAGAMPTPVQPAPPAEAMTPAMAAPNVTPQPGINPTQAPAAPAGAGPGQHAKLAAMVQGLADGLSGLSAGLASKGKVSGAEVVQNLEAGRQNQRIQAQQATEAQKSEKIRQDLMVGQTAELQMHNAAFLASMFSEISLKHLEVSGEQQKQAVTGADFQATHGGMTPEEYTKEMSGTSSVTGEGAGANPFFLNSAKSIQRAAKAAGLPSNNPAMLNMDDVLANPNSTAKQVAMATQQLSTEQQRLGAAGEQLAKQQAIAPLGDKVDALNKTAQDRYQVLNPGKPLPDEFKLPPEATQKDFDRVDGALSKIEGAQATKANRDIVNGMREQMLDLAKGVKIPGDETKTGAEYLASLPVGLQGTVKAIGTGRAAPPPAGSRSPAAQSILGALNRAYPDYDTTRYPTYLQTREKFAAGDIGKGLNAINTVEHHLARMYDHANSAFTSGGITGRITGFFGDKDVIALDDDATAVATELGKAYNAGAITEGEKNDWQKKLDIKSPGQTTGKLITSLKEIDGLLEGKQKAYQDQWAAATPSPSIVSPMPIISSTAAADRAHIRGEAAPTGRHNVGDSVTLKNGQTAVIKSIENGQITY